MKHFRNEHFDFLYIYLVVISFLFPNFIGIFTFLIHITKLFLVKEMFRYFCMTKNGQYNPYNTHQNIIHYNTYILSTEYISPFNKHYANNEFIPIMCLNISVISMSNTYSLILTLCMRCTSI